MLGGRRSGAFTALGVARGQAIWALATSGGVAALLVASAPLFPAVTRAGAAYLVCLGARALLAAFGRDGENNEARSDNRPGRARPAVALRQGVISNLGNPKMAAFFTSLLPQFAAAGQPSFWPLLLLGLLFSALTLVWLATYAVAVAKANGFLRRPKIRRAVEGATGAVLVALGLRLATERR